VYSRQVDDRVLEFGVSGKLMRNVLVMYDRQTESLWPQLLGRAVEGPLAGSELDYIASRLTTWADWKERHPNTVALVKGYSGSFDPYDSYYSSRAAGAIGETVRDDRLETKEFILGIVHQGQAKAYPFRTLSQDPIVNDQFAGLALLIVFDADSASGVVFDRRVEGEVLDFRQADGLELIDEQTGSRWDGLQGVAINGPLEGVELGSVRNTAAFWFGWKDIYPDTELYEN
jgi:hypothetical protein